MTNPDAPHEPGHHPSADAARGAEVAEVEAALRAGRAVPADVDPSVVVRVAAVEVALDLGVEPDSAVRP